MNIMEQRRAKNLQGSYLTPQEKAVIKNPIIDTEEVMMEAEEIISMMKTRKKEVNDDWMRFFLKEKLGNVSPKAIQAFKDAGITFTDLSITSEELKGKLLKKLSEYAETGKRVFNSADEEKYQFRHEEEGFHLDSVYKKHLNQKDLAEVEEKIASYNRHWAVKINPETQSAWKPSLEGKEIEIIRDPLLDTKASILEATKLISLIREQGNPPQKSLLKDLKSFQAASDNTDLGKAVRVLNNHGNLINDLISRIETSESKKKEILSNLTEWCFDPLGDLVQAKPLMNRVYQDDGVYYYRFAKDFNPNWKTEPEIIGTGGELIPEDFQEIKKSLFNEIKQNPAEWKIETEGKMKIIRHQSGRKHWLSKEMNGGEWSEIEKMVSEKSSSSEKPQSQQEVKGRDKNEVGKTIFLSIFFLAIGGTFLYLYFFLKRILRKKSK